MASLGSTQSYIKMANELLRQLQIPSKIYRLEEIGANIFVPLYEGLCGEELPEIRRNAVSRADQLFNLQAVIDNLSTDILHVSLSHIRAEDIIAGDRTAICNLLEIFQGLMEYLLQRMDSEAEDTGAEVDDLAEEEDEKKSERVLTPRKRLAIGMDSFEDVSIRPRERRKDGHRKERNVEEEVATPRSLLADGEVGDPLTTSDLRAERISEDIGRTQRVASELGHLADAVGEASLRRRLSPGSGERASELRRRICEYLAMRRTDLDLLASDLRPGAVQPVEDEWLADYLRLARARENGSPRGLNHDENRHDRLMSFPEEHHDRVDEVRNRRSRPPAPDPSDEAGRSLKREGGVAATMREDRRSAERAERINAARRGILRDCYDQSLGVAEQAADDVMIPRRKKVAGKENAIKRVASLRDAQRSSPRRGTGGLVRPQIKYVGSVGRTPPSALTVALPDDAIDADRDVLAYLIDQFPYLHLTHHTLNELWYRANRQKERLAEAVRDDLGRNQPLTREQMAMQEAERRQRILTEILHREIGYNRRLRDRKEREAAQRELRSRERERRQQAARAKKYYEEFAMQMRSKMLRARDKEEVMFRKLFKDALKTQRERIHDMRKYSRDVRDRRMAREMDEIKSLENYYRDRFNLLAHSLKKERRDIQTQDNEQTKFLQQMKRELRRKMEGEVRDLQGAIHTDQEDNYFRERDAERILFDLFRGGPADYK